MPCLPGASRLLQSKCLKSSEHVIIVLSSRLELRSKELEARLELEQTARCRLEAQTTRAKEAAASSAQAAGAAQARELQQAEEMRKIMRQLR